MYRFAFKFGHALLGMWQYHHECQQVYFRVITPNIKQLKGIRLGLMLFMVKSLGMCSNLLMHINGYEPRAYLSATTLQYLSCQRSTLTLINAHLLLRYRNHLYRRCSRLRNWGTCRWHNPCSIASTRSRRKAALLSGNHGGISSTSRPVDLGGCADAKRSRRLSRCSPSLAERRRCHQAIQSGGTGSSYGRVTHFGGK